MTFSQSIHSVFSKYATFSGRASRSEYWYFVLFNVLIGIILSIIAGVTMPEVSTTVVTDTADYYEACMAAVPGWLYTVSSLYSLFILLPSLALAVRRMHDIGNGGGWIFINLIPLIGQLWFFVLTILPSQLGDNRFGPQPE